MVLLDLAEVEPVCRAPPPVERRAAQRRLVPPRATTWVTRRCPSTWPSATWWRTGPATGRPGPVAVLTQLRTWGWLFNPITTYYCFDPTGSSVETDVVEVTNTPWHERTAYVLPGTGHPSGGQGGCTSPRSCRWTSPTASPSGSPATASTLAVDDLRGDELGVRRVDGAHPGARRTAGPWAGCCGDSR